MNTIIMPMKECRKKSILMTPDPYHTPGYGGFCPQFKYQIGETFGRTTSRLLRDTDVASSGRLVLAETLPERAQADRQHRARIGVISGRTASWGDKKLSEEMVPGYTGFIPKGQHYFGKRYAENSVNAISDFETSQQSHKTKMADLHVIKELQSGKIQKAEGDGLPNISPRNIGTLKPIAREAKPYIPKNSPNHGISPYYMKNTNPEKKQMSGYTGFVPRSRGMMGMGYPFITHLALNDFTDDVTHVKTIENEPVTIHREEVKRINTTPIYPKDTGLVPHYTGHIPGEKFRYGQTFGHSTKNAGPF